MVDVHTAKLHGAVKHIPASRLEVDQRIEFTVAVSKSWFKSFANIGAQSSTLIRSTRGQVVAIEEVPSGRLRVTTGAGDTVFYWPGDLVRVVLDGAH